MYFVRKSYGLCNLRFWDGDNFKNISKNLGYDFRLLNFLINIQLDKVSFSS